ncbi:histidine kinase dimerization/phosphoacceptor domain -containing protein [Methanobacterium oryzae]|uniref:sensor histidine kinase n=1 Tax=Methanobacterium oryzae TaxID=69540 RepID=UPI003D262299
MKEEEVMKVSSLTDKSKGNISLKVLIIEDSEDDTLLIIRKLKQGGYNPLFKRIDTPEEMINALETEEWDIVISDYIMPKFNGLDALKLLKEKKLDMPFIIVSGNIGEDIAINAMVKGAHDYIMKDNLSRLIPAINRELKEADVRRERRKAEKALQESEEKFRVLAENVPASIIVYQGNKNIYVNDYAVKASGYSEEELYSRNMWESFHLDDQQKIKEMSISRLRDEEVPNRYEVRYITKSGEIMWVDISTGNFIYKEKPAGIAMLVDITERKNAEKVIKDSLSEKEVLIREIHHRVKNNMQIISSLLSLQARSIEDEKTFELFRDSQNRVKSMALIHEKLYQSDNLAEIDFKEYINNFTTDLIRSYGVVSNISLIIKVDKISLGVNTAIPCGLIINELLTNSIKHAFRDGEKGKIKIELDQITENEYRLIFSDNGIGLPENFEFKNVKSLGLRLVNSLTEQLNGKIDLERENGTKFIITFIQK